MGEATAALSEATGQTTSNPLLIVMTAVAGLVGFGLNFLLGLIPVAGNLIAAPIFAVLMAGVLGMAYAGARDNTTGSISDYGSTLGESGLTVFAASLIKNILLGVVAVGVGIVLLVVPLFVVGFGGAATTGVGSDGLGPGGVGALVAGTSLLLVLAFLLFFVAILALQMGFQFIDSAVVVGGKSATEALSESWGLLTESPGDVLVFSVLRGLLFLGMFVVVGVVAAVGGQVAPDLGVVFAGVGFLIGYPTVGTLAFVYEVRYYMRRRPGASAESRSDSRRSRSRRTEGRRTEGRQTEEIRSEGERTERRRSEDRRFDRDDTEGRRRR